MFARLLAVPAVFGRPGAANPEQCMRAVQDVGCVVIMGGGDVGDPMIVPEVSAFGSGVSSHGCHDGIDGMRAQLYPGHDLSIPMNARRIAGRNRGNRSARAHADGGGGPSTCMGVMMAGTGIAVDGGAMDPDFRRIPVEGFVD